MVYPSREAMRISRLATRVSRLSRDLRMPVAPRFPTHPHPSPLQCACMHIIHFCFPTRSHPHSASAHIIHIFLRRCASTFVNAQRACVEHGSSIFSTFIEQLSGTRAHMLHLPLNILARTILKKKSYLEIMLTTIFKNERLFFYQIFTRIYFTHKTHTHKFIYRISFIQVIFQFFQSLHLLLFPMQCLTQWLHRL